MKPLRLLFLVAALIAAVCAPSVAFAETYYPTEQELQQVERYRVSDSDIQTGIDSNRNIQSGDRAYPLPWYSFFRPMLDQGLGYNMSVNARANVNGVLAAGVLAAIGIVFLWWGVRKVVQMIFSGFRKGKINV